MLCLRRREIKRGQGKKVRAFFLSSFFPGGSRGGSVWARHEDYGWRDKFFLNVVALKQTEEFDEFVLKCINWGMGLLLVGYGR